MDVELNRRPPGQSLTLSVAICYNLKGCVFVVHQVPQGKPTQCGISGLDRDMYGSSSIEYRTLCVQTYVT